MATNKQTDAATGSGDEAQPAWADGLKQLYDNVVDEPLPDAFMDLLAKLDDSDDHTASTGAGDDA